MFILGVESFVKCYEGWSPMSKYVSWKNPESEDCNTDLSDKFKDLESSDVLILHQATIILQNRISTRGPWWSYIAQLSKQLCILTVEVSAKFTALRFLYKFYSPAPQWPCFFSWHHDGLNWILKEDHQRNNSAIILKLVQWFLTKRFLKCLI